MPLPRDGTEDIHWKFVDTGRQGLRDQCRMGKAHSSSNSTSVHRLSAVLMVVPMERNAACVNQCVCWSQQCSKC